MKQNIKITIPFHYIGIHYAKKPNYYAKLIYKAKFLQQPYAVKQIAKLLLLHIPAHTNLIIPVWTTHTKTNLPNKIAYIIGKKLNIPVIYNYWHSPRKWFYYTKKQKNILILDDIVTTGKTLKKAIAIAKKTTQTQTYTSSHSPHLNPKVSIPQFVIDNS